VIDLQIERISMKKLQSKSVQGASPSLTERSFQRHAFDLPKHLYHATVQLWAQMMLYASGSETTHIVFTVCTRSFFAHLEPRLSVLGRFSKLRQYGLDLPIASLQQVPKRVACAAAPLLHSALALRPSASFQI
jgi:hypothetical protein